MIVSEITLYNALKMKLGETEAQTVVESIKQIVDHQFEQQKDTLATKQDIADLKLATQKDIAELRLDMEKGFKDNLKWTIATFLVVAGLIVTALRFM